MPFRTISWNSKSGPFMPGAAALALVLAASATLWSAGPLDAAEIVCPANGVPLETPHAQIVFDPATGACSITDAGPAPKYAIRAFLVPGFSTPAALAQKIEAGETSPPDSFVTTWTHAVTSNDAHASGFLSKDLGTFSATLSSELKGTRYTMDVTFTVAPGNSISIDAAHVTFPDDDGALVTGSLATPLPETGSSE